MTSFDLEGWLRAHSTDVRQHGNEVIFTHTSGETSVLVLRPGARGDLVPPLIPALAAFYEKYAGASIGNSHLMFASSIPGGVEVSHDFRLPDAEQMADLARRLGVSIGDSEEVFLSVAGYMFFYAHGREHDRDVIRLHDRDFGTTDFIERLDDVLEEWWTIVIADRD